MEKSDTKFEVIPVEIGSVVDFISNRIRCRGLVLNMHRGICLIGVIGTSTLYSKPADDCTPVRSSRDFITFSNPK